MSKLVAPAALAIAPDSLCTTIVWLPAIMSPFMIHLNPVAVTAVFGSITHLLVTHPTDTYSICSGIKPVATNVNSVYGAVPVYEVICDVPVIHVTLQAAGVGQALVNPLDITVS